jgi:lipoyl(octanoyl) transferase
MTEFHANIPYEIGLGLQAAALEEVIASPKEVHVFGFEHTPVVSMGVRAKLNDILSLKNLKGLGFEVIDTDRGGQATLHMPGQLVIYPVLDLREYNLTVKSWICLLSQTTIKTVKEFGIEAHWDSEKPGLYTNRGKLAAVGVRIRRGVSQHGICINVSNSLEPYQWLIPCGIQGQTQDRLSDWGYVGTLEELFNKWNQHFQNSLTTL